MRRQNVDGRNLRLKFSRIGVLNHRPGAKVIGLLNFVASGAALPKFVPRGLPYQVPNPSILRRALRVARQKTKLTRAGTHAPTRRTGSEK